jgi:MFS family permease
VRRHVRIDFRLQRRHQHPPGAFTDQHVEVQLEAGSVLVVNDYAQHGRALLGRPRGRPGSCQTGGYATLLTPTSIHKFRLYPSTALVGAQSPWAWRLPFIASLALVAVGLYVRLGILETPTFSRLLEEHRTERRPVRAVLARHPGEVILTALIKIGDQVPLVLMTTFFLVYTGVLHLAMGIAIAISIWSGLVGVVCTPFFGYVSDRIGRRRTYFYGALLMLLFALPYFAFIGSRDVGLILGASLVAQVLVAMMAGPEAVSDRAKPAGTDQVKTSH